MICLSGSPPRGRGKVCHSGPSCLRSGITPAWAGKSNAELQKLDVTEDHPRVGGEKRLILFVLRAVPGSPPRGRGKDKAEHLVQHHIGITPAQAGKS